MNEALTIIAVCGTVFVIVALGLLSAAGLAKFFSVDVLVGAAVVCVSIAAICFIGAMLCAQEEKRARTEGRAKG